MQSDLHCVVIAQGAIHLIWISVRHVPWPNVGIINEGDVTSS
jgi:hypothetical protein